MPWEQVYLSDDGTSLYQPGDLVWAKVQGHPWYPGEVMRPEASYLKTIDRKEGTVKVRFFDEPVENARTW